MCEKIVHKPFFFFLVLVDISLSLGVGIGGAWVGHWPLTSHFGTRTISSMGFIARDLLSPAPPYTNLYPMILRISILCYIYLIFLPCWATCPTSSCISCAINPMIPKITNPAKNEVAQLPIDTTSASLKMTTENNSKFLVPHHLIGSWQFCTLSGLCYCSGGVPSSGYRLECLQRNLVSVKFRTLIHPPPPPRKLTQYYEPSFYESPNFFPI